jgi:hypothetical protein
MTIFDNEKKAWVSKINIETFEVEYTEDEKEALQPSLDFYNYYVFVLNNPAARFGRPKDRQPK